MNEHTKDSSKAFPSFSQLSFNLTSTNSDYIPTQSFRSHTEKGHILDASLVSIHLSDDIKRASWLESFIAPYLADLADARQRIAYQKCLLSPIRRIPVEILQSIFIACLPQGFVEADPDTAPMILCQICKYWRDVALALPVLWASFKVRRPSKGPCTPAFPLAEIWLERSKPVPISICLPIDSGRGCNPESAGVEMFVRLFLRHLSRWKAVHMCLRDLLFHEGHIPDYLASTVLEELELCFSLDSHTSLGPYDLAIRNLGGIVPRIWSSSSRLHSLTLNATVGRNVIMILRTCSNIRDCEFHISNDMYDPPDYKLTLPLLHTLNIRARTTFFTFLDAITTPSLRILTMKGEKGWNQKIFEDLINRSSCSIEEFTMMNILISPDNLLRTLEHIGTGVKVLRIHNYPQGSIARPISHTILRGIASHLLVPNLEVLDFGCDGMEPEHDAFVEMVSSRLGWGSGHFSRLASGSGASRLIPKPSSHSHLSLGPTAPSNGPLLRRIRLSPDRCTTHMHTESLALVEALGAAGMDVDDDAVWRAYRIDGWFHNIRIWPGFQG